MSNYMSQLGQSLTGGVGTPAVNSPGVDSMRAAAPAPTSVDLGAQFGRVPIPQMAQPSAPPVGVSQPNPGFGPGPMLGTGGGMAGVAQMGQNTAASNANAQGMAENLARASGPTNGFGYGR